jgi:hypothetical protein
LEYNHETKKYDAARHQGTFDAKHMYMEGSVEGVVPESGKMQVRYLRAMKTV